MQSHPSAPPSTPTSDIPQPISTTRPSRAPPSARPPPAVPFYPDIRRRLRYRNNALALGITGQKNHLIQRLLLYCPRLGSDLCSILCTCENTLEPDNPWLSASWVPLADTDTKAAVHFVPSPNHSHTWVMTPDGLKEAAEVLEAIMKYDMPKLIHEQFTEAAQTFSQIYQGLQAEMRLYSGRYGAGRELHTKWEIHWNKNEHEEREWKEVKYQKTIKYKADVQAGRRHVMQTTGMTEEEIVQRARTPSRKRRRGSSNTLVPMMQVEEQPFISAPPMRTYYQRSGFVDRSAVAADWLSEVPNANMAGTTPAPIETSSSIQTSTAMAALIQSQGWVTMEEAALAAAAMYTGQQSMVPHRWTFPEWVRYAQSVRLNMANTAGLDNALPAARPDNTQSQMVVSTHYLAQSQVAEEASRQAATTMHGGHPQVIQLDNNTILRRAQHLTARAPDQLWSLIPSPESAGGTALERMGNGLPLIEGPPLFSVGSTSNVAPTAPNIVMPSEHQQLRPRAISLVNRGRTRRVRNGRPSLARYRDVELSNEAMPGSRARADNAAIRERNRNAALHNRGADLNGSSGVAIPSGSFHYEVQDGRAAAAATIRAVDDMRRARVANSAQEDRARAYHALSRESGAALHTTQRAESTASPVATTPTTLANSEEQTVTVITAAGATNMMWQPWLATNAQPSLARPHDAEVQGSDAALLERYRAVLAAEEHEIRSSGRISLERRADRRRADGQQASPRALDITVTNFVRQRDPASVDGTVTRRSQRAVRSRSVFHSNTRSETDEDAFWWQ